MFKVKKELEKGNFVKFVLEPLEAGFGHTLGNSLRRVLLTSLDGAAVTSVRIEGVAHQFSTIAGVSEDVTEILLNIKKLRIKLHSDKPIKLTLKVSGKKEVTVKDIEVLGDGEVVNLDQHIATLNSANAKLNMEMTAEAGKGYSISDERKLNEIGLIAVDALFSPVLDVNYSIESTRVGRRTDLDKLILEITTDGTMTPQESLEEAAKILSLSFKQIFEPIVEVEDDGLKSQGAVFDEVLKMSVEEIDLPVRITNALKAIDINTIEDLIKMPRGQLLKAKNLGTKSLSLISEKLSERGLSLQ
ncbi:DNA-directed RNA polymerase subunit alpha [Candidatus Daviesbacteria bacterium]|nr:DNA-directed RNA polymerase subunit alpha [Candidatus Daviesbacteria bacterium]